MLRTSARTFILALVFSWATGCASIEAETPRHVILVTVEGLRADQIDPELTPELSAAAERGAHFARAVTTSPQTLPALATLHTGLPPSEHGVVDAYTRPLGDVPTLATAFAEAGWKTTALPAYFLAHRKSGLDRGFADFRHEAAGWTNAARADSAARLLAASDDTTTFFWVGATLAPRRTSWNRYLGSGSANADDYRENVRALDADLRRILRAVAARDDALLIVAGVNGENVPGMEGPEPFTQPPGAGFDLTEGELRVPLIVSGANTEPREIGEWVSTLDVAPTIRTLAGVDAPVGDGVSLTSALSGDALPQRVIYHETDVERVTGWPRRLAARSGDHKVVVHGETYLALSLPTGEPATGDAIDALVESLESRYELSFSPANVEHFGRENRELVELPEILARGASGDPRGARAAVESLATAHPANGILQIEHGRALAYGRNERAAAFFFDELRESDPALVEAESAYHELLRLFARHEVIASRMDSLNAGPMYEPEQLWTHATALVASERFTEARETFSLAAMRSAAPTPWFERVRNLAPRMEQAVRDLAVLGSGYDPHLELGRVLGELGLYRDAYEHLNQARGLKSFDPEPEYWLGHYLMLDNRPRHAIVAFDRALDSDAGHVPSLREKAYAQMLVGELDEAFETLARAVGTGGASPDIHYNYACLLARRGETDEALHQLEIAVTKGYDDRERLARDGDLDPLRDDPRFPEIIDRISSR